MDNDSFAAMSGVVTDAQTRFVKEYLDRGVSSGDVAGMMLQVYERHDENALMFEHQFGRGRAKVACKQGCSFCCRQRVSVTAPEVLAAVFYAKLAMDADELNTFRVKANGAAQRAALQGDAEIFSEHIPCIFLEQGECSVYPYRPLACRSETSLNVKLCEKGFGDLTVKVIKPENAIVKAVAVGYVGALGASLEMKQLDGRWYELNTAVAEALADPDCEKRLLNGGRAFNNASYLPQIEWEQ
jgi:Fe-S-cluster containining protein